MIPVLKVMVSPDRIDLESERCFRSAPARQKCERKGAVGVADHTGVRRRAQTPEHAAGTPRLAQRPRNRGLARPALAGTVQASRGREPEHRSRSQQVRRNESDEHQSRSDGHIPDAEPRVESAIAEELLRAADRDPDRAADEYAHDRDHSSNGDHERSDQHRLHHVDGAYRLRIEAHGAHRRDLPPPVPGHDVGVSRPRVQV